MAQEYSLELGADTPWALAQYDISAAKQILTEPAIASDTTRSHSPDPWISQEKPISDLHLSPTNSCSISPVSVQVQRSQISPSSHTIPISENLVATETGLVNFEEHEACLIRYFVVQLAHWVSNQAKML